MSTRQRPSTGMDDCLSVIGEVPDRQFRTAMSLLADGDRSQLLEAVDLIGEAAAAGHAEATERRAVLEAVGVVQAPDWNKALNSLADAAELGSSSAAQQLILLAENRFTATLSACTHAGTWREMRSRVSLPERLRPPEPNGLTLSGDPFVRAIDTMCSIAECQWLVAAATPRLERAEVFGAGVDRGRTNQSAVLGLSDTDLVAQMIRTRIANELGAPLPCLEVPQVLRYAVGEEFVLHCDFLDPRLLQDEIDRAGQRSATFLIYLNEDFDGGETSFPVLGIDHRGRTGDGLVFGNLDRFRAPDARTQHAGKPPTRGVKWVFSQWIRDRYAA